MVCGKVLGGEVACLIAAAAAVVVVVVVVVVVAHSILKAGPG